MFMDSLFSSDKKVSITNAQHPLLLKTTFAETTELLDDDDDENDKQKAWDKLAPGVSTTIVSKERKETKVLASYNALDSIANRK